ncbi:MAG: acyl-CoA reductase, partial [Schleiferiaceae bacterium]
MFFSDHRIDAVSNLGAFLRSVASGAPAPEGLEDLAEALRAAATKSLRHNGWFTEANVYHALASWG